MNDHLRQFHVFQKLLNASGLVHIIFNVIGYNIPFNLKLESHLTYTWNFYTESQISI